MPGPETKSPNIQKTFQRDCVVPRVSDGMKPSVTWGPLSTVGWQTAQLWSMRMMCGYQEGTGKTQTLLWSHSFGGASLGAVAIREKKNSALGRRSCEPSPGHSQKLVRSWSRDKPLHPDKSTDQSVDAVELVFYITGIRVTGHPEWNYYYGPPQG